ncbi:MAG: SAM-dependent methyltransferase [Thermoanaerobaculia bacterium]
MALRLAISLISAAAIAYEILLIRLFSIIQWHHYAYMVISLALLGYGMSGTFLTLFRRPLEQRFPAAFRWNAVLFGLLSVGCFSAAQALPFNPLETIWDHRQLYYLGLLYLLLALPFCCAANCIGLALTRCPTEIHRTYRADLLGAGCGAVALVAALFLLPPSRCLLAVGALGLLAAAVAGLDPRFRRRRRAPWVLAAASLVLAFASPAAWLDLRLSDYKGLSKALRVPETRVVRERSSPLGLLTVVRSPRIPFRHAPGLSLNFTGEPPNQLGLFTDGDSMTVINRFTGDWGALAYLDFLPSALPYHLLQTPRVAVMGAGGGTEVLSALYHGSRQIDAVEYNPQVIDLVRRDFRDFAGELLSEPRVRVHVAEARGFLAGESRRFDLIQIAHLDSRAASAAGVHALSESYLYTVEAFEAYLRHLRDGGLLAITRWLKVPPRDSLKLFLTAVEALEGMGVSDPERRLALVRSWSSVVLLVKNGRLTDHDVVALRDFSAARSFDVAYYPGMQESEANRTNLLEEPYLFRGARALLGEGRRSYLERYKFRLEAATDDRPYFFHFFKWRVLPELLKMRGRGGAPLIEQGYLLLIATLVQAILAGLLLILLPLRFLRRCSPKGSGVGRPGLYFLGLGLAFLFVEIAFIQRFTLFLAHPLYAVAVVLASFLFFAGLGSGFSDRWAELHRRRRLRGSAIDAAILGIGAVALLYLIVLPRLFDRLMGWNGGAKVLLALVLIGPLAFLMGMPFPLGLKWVAATGSERIPWVWGVNGCASVLSPVLATVIAIHLGFTAVVGLAVALYLLAALAIRGVGDRPEPG